MFFKVSVLKEFAKILQNPQENTCAGVFFKQSYNSQNPAGVSLWILPNFYEQLVLYNTSSTFENSGSVNKTKVKN